MCKIVSCLLLVSCLFLTKGIMVSAQTSPPANNSNQSAKKVDQQSEKIKKKIEKIGLGNDITLVLTGGREFYGSVKSIETDTVLIYEVDTKQLIEIKYVEINKVWKGYGGVGFNGKRIKPSKQKIGLIVGLAAIFIPVIIALRSLR